MRIALSAGHNVYINNNFDPGAVGNNKREADITKKTVATLKPLLEKQGHTVIDVTPYNQKFDNSKEHHVLRCKRVDEFKADLFLDIHINSGGGTGVECWVYSQNSTAYPYAKQICESISKDINIRNRGVKTNPSYWSLSLCKAPAIIIEGAFIDNPDDMQKLAPEKYAIAIAKVFGEVKLEDTSSVLYRVQVGAYKNKTNAEYMLKKLKDAGFTGIIVESKVEDSKVINPENSIEVIDMLEYKEVVKYSSKGEHVKELQRVLKDLGYYHDSIDGIAGKNTVLAIKIFQQDYNLAVDGIAGRQTYNMINEVLNTGKRPNNNYKILRPDIQTTVVQIPHEQIKLIDVIVANTKNGRETLSNMQKRTNCDFIINGGFYWTDEKSVSHSLNLLIDEYKQQQAGVYSRFGLRIFKDNKYEFDWYKWSPELKDMLGGSPSLVINGEINIDGKPSGNITTARHPRTAIGMDDSHFYLVTIDGRRASQGLKGMTVDELAKFMLGLGCKNAINLDGGGSTRLMHKQTVLNKPLENRPVNNAVGIKLR